MIVFGLWLVWLVILILKSLEGTKTYVFHVLQTYTEKKMKWSSSFSARLNCCDLLKCVSSQNFFTQRGSKEQLTLTNPNYSNLRNVGWNCKLYMFFTIHVLFKDCPIFLINSGQPCGCHHPAVRAVHSIHFEGFRNIVSAASIAQSGYLRNEHCRTNSLH